ncbi:MAG: VIT1/CCC1 transporter family protein [Comamonadaceae bacterium]|nr:VIT1/CCC1 transporter family protein [Comamonadaceae bacterium]
MSDVGARRHKGYGGGNLRAAGVRRQRRARLQHQPDHGRRRRRRRPQACVLTGGVAGTAAQARSSMAAGEYVSMRSQREMFEYQIGLERDELARVPGGRGGRARADLRGARHARSRRRAASRRELVKNPEARARRAGARGARPQSRRSRLAVGRRDLFVPRVRVPARCCRWCRSCSDCRCGASVTVAAIASPASRCSASAPR